VLQQASKQRNVRVCRPGIDAGLIQHEDDSSMTPFRPNHLTLACTILQAVHGVGRVGAAWKEASSEQRALACDWPWARDTRATDAFTNAAQHARSSMLYDGVGREPYRWHDPRSLAAVPAIVSFWFPTHQPHAVPPPTAW